MLGGPSNQKRKEKQPAATPQERLQRFKRLYNSFLQICNKPQSLGSRGSAVDNLYELLQRLNSIIREEGHAPAPHVCLQFAASSQLYSVVARAASASQDERMIRETVTLFGMLVDSQEEEFLGSSHFARALMRFAMRVIDSRSIMLSADTEVEVVEVLFGVAAKIRAQPEILHAYFTSATRPEPEDVLGKEKRDFAGITQKEDFPLCYLLIDRIHHEGRIGDFARTGLLYIFEAASQSSDLEEWIIASDLPTLMASGLGALYSQLSRELSVLHDPEQLPLILAMSDYVQLHMPSTAESIFSPNHAGHMSTFLSHLAFWQDVLEHCKSPDVKQTLVDHFQILFLQQLLYPSLLQSSDTDGGSSVAVLTYLTNMLESLDHPDLIHMVLQYLLAIPETSKPPGSKPTSPTATRRQSSLMLLTASQSEEEKLEPTLFNLVDLILNGLQSQNPQTALAALKLSSIILSRHRKYALSTLLRTTLARGGVQRTVGVLQTELESYLAIAFNIGLEGGMDEAFAEACQDLRGSLELQYLLKQSQGRQSPSASIQDLLTRTIPDTDQHFRLPPTDPFLIATSDLLKTFLTNNVDVNLALTEALVNLATCTNIGLEGWIATEGSDAKRDDTENGQDPAAQTFQGMDAEEIAALQSLRSVQQQPALSASNMPPLLKILQALSAEVDALRAMHPSLDDLVSKRKEILRGVPLSAAPTSQLSPSPLPRQSLEFPGSPKPNSLPQRFHQRSGSNTRSASPAPLISSRRGRQSVDLNGAATRSAVSPGSSLPSPRILPSPAMFSANVFQPPPRDVDDSLARGSPRTGGRAVESEGELLAKKIRFPLQSSERNGTTESDESGEGKTRKREVTLSHVLTNIVVLQQFAVEVAAVMQMRAWLLEEVRFA